MKKIIYLIITVLYFSTLAHAQYVAPADKKEEGSSMQFKGPSMHLGGGIRMKKSPDNDTVDYGLIGLKFAPFSMMFGQTYLTFAAGGFNYIGKDHRFVLSLTPIMFNHISGLGIGFDLYHMRADRSGGLLGVSLNLDIIQLTNFISGFMK